MLDADAAAAVDPGWRRRFVYLALAIILLGFMVRVSTFKAPLFDHHAWRQAHTATMARNFYRENLNLLLPQVDERGAQSVGYITTGAELPAFAVALIAGAVSDFHFEIGRLLSSLFYLAAAGFLFAFVRRRYDLTHALVALFVHAFCFPLLIYMDRAFMNESLLVALTIASLWAAQRFLDVGRAVYLLLLIAASSTVAAVKFPFLILWAPVVGLFIEHYGLSTLRRIELYAVAAANLLVGWLWYRHAAGVSEQTGLTVGLTDKLFAWDLALSPGFYRVVLRGLAFDVLGPLAILLLVVGLVWTTRQGLWAERLAIAGFGAYVLIVARGVFVHDYYLIPVVPIGLVLVAVGSVVASKRISTVARAGHLTDPMLALSALLAVMLLSAYVRSVSFHSWYDIHVDRQETCALLRDVTGPDDRVLFLHYNSPDILFCADRKGWLLAPGASTEAALLRAVAAGAVAVVSPPGLVPDTLRALTHDLSTRQVAAHGWTIDLLAP